MIAKFVLTLIAGILIAAPAGAAGIECGKQSSVSDHIICGDRSLRTRDAITNDLYAAAMKTDDASAVREKQLRWVKSLQACADAACLRRTYDDQIGYLQSTKGGQSVSTVFFMKETSGDEGNLAVFGPSNGLVAISLNATHVGPGGAEAGDVNADGVAGVIALKSGHGTLAIDKCTVSFDRHDTQVWQVTQKGTCNFADGVILEGIYRR